MDLKTFMSQHQNVVLQFSAGKESAACLKLLRPYIDQVTLVWANPGDPYKVTIEYMDKIKASVPNFQEWRGRQRMFVKEQGYPLDMIPFEATVIGRVASGETIRATSVAECCAANLWMPLYVGTKAVEATGVIRGERKADELKSDIGPYKEIDGRCYFNPIYDWSLEQLIGFLGDDLPPSYKKGLKSSLDCRSCTAYLVHNPGRLAYLKKAEPDAYVEIIPILEWYRVKLESSLNHLKDA